MVLGGGCIIMGKAWGGSLGGGGGGGAASSAPPPPLGLISDIMQTWYRLLLTG